MKGAMVGLLMFVVTLGFAQTEPVLFVYDEHTESLDRYIQWIKDELTDHQIAFEEAPAQEVGRRDLGKYRGLVVYSAVMALNMKSPVRDWLSSGPKVGQKKVALLVTANRWFLDSLTNQQTKLLKQLDCRDVDVVTSATKDLDEAQKRALVKTFVDRISQRI